jgi:5-methylcytosine-specific restriction endonuclease McrA
LKIHYVCEVCGKKDSRRYAINKVPSHFFCSNACQNKWQKTREDLVIKNKDPLFRIKVSAGLKHRKETLGSEYHSAETKKKIGEQTKIHWDQYDSEKRERLTRVLQNNALQMRTYGQYDYEWQKLSDIIKRGKRCHRCGKTDNLCVHHIIPVSAGGTRSTNNLVTLCLSCHRTVENEGKKINEIIGDWEIIRLLITERLMCSI